jgi:23S rRNA (guanine1835-N2)-methyltransferase
MARRKKTAATLGELVSALEGKLQPPFGVVLGSPHEATEIVEALQDRLVNGGRQPPGSAPDGAQDQGADAPRSPGRDAITCYQMDLYQAGRLTGELDEYGLAARVVAAADLWDLPEPVQTLVYPIPQRGERALKLDMLEQAFHALRPHGRLVVLTPYEKDQLIPAALKKVFGRVHAPAAGEGAVFWAQREGDRPRRRHEVTFQVNRGEAPSLRFVSRPGTFSYGRFDDGARALVETAEVRPGDAVLDLGCGCGTNGVWAGLGAGPEGSVAFLDSNVRAVALVELNARANGLTSFRAVASSDASGVPEESFDMALANPPYYAQLSIAQLFIDRGEELLRPGGRFYLVTRQPDQVGPLVAEVFGTTQVVLRRGYTVLCAERRG